MARIEFDRSVCSTESECFSREWLETNGIGGFSSATISGANTRRYHGLLMAATVPPTGRTLLLSKLEETLIVGERRYELSANLYPGAVHPRGFEHAAGFRLDPFPIFTFEVDGVKVEKRVFLAHGSNTVVVEYEASLDSGAACRIEIRPLIAFRDYHSLTHENGALNGGLEEADGLISIEPYNGLPRLFFGHNADRVERDAGWYRNFQYPIERERGLDFEEDLYSPFVLEFDVTAGAPAVVIASTEAHRAEEAAALRNAEIARRTEPTLLHAAAEQFIVARGKLRTIIAGYPWFTDWGRDTMISLPGIALATGKFDVARDLLRAFANSVDQGMLPNRFSEAGDTPEYNTVDATLWFFEAIRKYVEATGDTAFVRQNLYACLKEILDWHIKGTRYGIHADDDGLLHAGDANTQLTWMDARVGDHTITPRNGKPVEIQALWINALRFAAEFGKQKNYGTLVTKAAKSFNAQFWNEEGGCLYDVIDGDRRDASIRPNQVIALSLGYCAIPEDRARKVLEVAARDLLTPYGLRTLAPFDAAYCGRCDGPPWVRDAAYHQGTVWPWLLGPFITADARFNGDAGRRRAAEILTPIDNFLKSRGTGQMPEIFDGDAPHAPRGCPAQAWSVAELLRAAAENLSRSASA